MSGGDMVSALDATYAEIARLKTFAVGGGSTVSHQVVLGRV
jgi:hypothetical protein